MNLHIYYVDAFTQEVFKGNTAAVCVLDEWLQTQTMQKIAQQINLSETVFCVKLSEGHYQIRWFTPAVEVDLCGHATLACAYVLHQYFSQKENITFSSKSGQLFVKSISNQKLNQENALFELDFPMDVYQQHLNLNQTANALDPLNIKLNAKFDENLYQKLKEILGFEDEEIEEILTAKDYVIVYQNTTQIKHITPRFDIMKNLDLRGVVVTAKNIEDDSYDFGSRFFAPKLGIDEDPVTGAIHCTLFPYWQQRLAKSELHAKQLSARGGDLYGKTDHLTSRVLISGYARLFLKGEIKI